MATEAQSAAGSQDTATEGGVRRRDFLNVAAVSFAGVGAVAAVAPLLVQMAPPADVLALATTEVDISKIQPGQAIKTSWRKQPVFIRNLTPAEIKAANAVPLPAPGRTRPIEMSPERRCPSIVVVPPASSTRGRSAIGGGSSRATRPSSS